MPGKNIVGGIVAVLLDGVRIRVKGNVEYELGVPEVTPVVGHDEVHGFKEMPKPARLKFSTTDTADLDMRALLTKRNVTAFLEKPNGKGVVFSESTVSATGSASTEEGEIELEIFALRAEEV